MPQQSTTSIVLYGKIIQDAESWKKWYEYAIKRVKDFGFKPNYIGVTGEQFKFQNIKTVARYEKKLLQAIDDGTNISSISIFALPKEFKQAAFDYNIYFCRVEHEKHSHVMLTMLTSLFVNSDYKNIIKELKEHIEFTNGQVFEMTNYDSPQFYAYKVNPDSFYKSLKVIEELT